jgi:hypothetical protein
MMMTRLFDFDNLVLDWKWNRYKTESTALYGITLLVVNAVGQAANIMNRNEAQTAQTGVLPDLVGTLLVLGLAVLAFSWLWKANGGKDGNFFLEKVLSMGIVLTVTRVVPLVVISIGTSLFLQRIAPKFVTGFLFIAIVAVLGTIVYCLTQLHKSLGEIRTLEYNRSLERHKGK